MATLAKGIPNTKLRAQRKKRGWSQQMVADSLVRLSEEAGQISGITGELVGRWERGINIPSPFYQEKLMRLFNASAEELGLLDDVYDMPAPDASGTRPAAQAEDENVAALLPPATEPPDPELTAAHTWLNKDRAAQAEDYHSGAERLMATVMRLLIERQQGSLSELQRGVYKQIRSYDEMAEHKTRENGQMTRRQALQVIATMPIEVYGLAALGVGVVATPPAAEFLSLCAAGLVAARNLLSLEDMPLIAGVVRAYLPTLEALAQRSSPHQQQAAHLASQAYLLATIVVDHWRKLDQMEAYSRAARRYGQLASDPNLEASALARLAVKFSYERRYRMALQTYQEAVALTGFNRITPLLQGRIYFGLAGSYARCGQEVHEQEALKYLGIAKEIYPIIPQDDPTYHFAYSGADTPFLWEGLVYMHTNHYQQAKDAFGQKGTLAPLPELRETNRAEFLTDVASVALRQGELDTSVVYLEAAEEVAWSIGHVQRYAEVSETLRNMQLIWPREPAIKRLHDKMYERGGM